MSDIEKLSEIIPEASQSEIDKFTEFFDLLQHYNSKLNLVAKSTLARAGTKHFADSFYGVKIVEKFLKRDTPLFDFGSGNGFPGIIAAIMYPENSLILVERDQRKAEFLKIASSSLSIKNVEVFDRPLADLNDGCCHVAISRAMAPLPKFLLEARNVMAAGGSAFLFKGDSWMTEFGACPPQIFDFWDVSLLDSYIVESEDSSQKYIVQCKRLS